jgi:hypothetical protein
VTKEHLFGSWLSPLFVKNAGDVTMLHTLKRGHNAVKPRIALGLDQQVNMPCGPCNHGWMSRLETAVAPIVTPLIQGHDRVLTVAERTTVAAWVLKTAMVAEYLNKPHERYFTQPERTAFMTRVAAPRDGSVAIWFGRYSGINAGVQSLFGFTRATDGAPFAHLSTFALGELVVQILVERATVGGRPREAARPGPWRDSLLDIWPPIFWLHHRPLPKWPPPKPLDALGFQRLFDRFLAPGAQRDRYPG